MSNVYQTPRVHQCECVGIEALEISKPFSSGKQIGSNPISLEACEPGDELEFVLIHMPEQILS